MDCSNSLSNLSNLPKELHFHIFLYLPYIEAHYAITALYRPNECEEFWRLYLVNHFYVSEDRIIRFRAVEDTTLRELCHRFAVNLRSMFSVKSYPKISYFDDLTEDLIGGYILDDNKFESETLLSSRIRDDDLGNLSEDIDFSYTFPGINDGTLAPLDFEIISGVLQNILSSNTLEYIDKTRQKTKYITPVGLIYVPFDIDLFYQFNSMIEKNLTEGAIVLIYKRLRCFMIDAHKFIETLISVRSKLKVVPK